MKIDKILVLIVIILSLVIIFLAIIQFNQTLLMIVVILTGITNLVSIILGNKEKNKFKHLKKYWALYLAILGILLLFLIGYIQNGSLINFDNWRFRG